MSSWIDMRTMKWLFLVVGPSSVKNYSFDLTDMAMSLNDMAFIVLQCEIQICVLVKEEAKIKRSHVSNKSV